VGYVLQTGGLLPFLNVRQNIELAVRLGQEDACRPAAAGELAERLNLRQLWNKMPDKLSVGERQRVALARALINRPALILADEPTAALDQTHARMVMDLLIQTVRDWRLTLILVTHDQGLTSEYAFRHFTIRSAREQDKITRASLNEAGYV
jgi:putative ABC transport system ATP-binding protein